MPQLSNLQTYKTKGSPLPFLLPKQAQWELFPWRVQIHEVNISASSIALREPQDIIKIWQQTGTSTITQYLIRLIEQLYIFRRPKEVFVFLQTHSFLVPLLLEVRSSIARYFGLSSQIILEVVSDPEAADYYQLVAFIQTNLHPNEALADLDQLDQGWWLEASHTSKGKMCIHLEYQ